MGLNQSNGLVCQTIDDYWVGRISNWLLSFSFVYGVLLLYFFK